MRFFITYNMRKTNLKNSSSFLRKLQKTVFRALHIFPQIHRSVEITVAIELYYSQNFSKFNQLFEFSIENAIA